MAKVTAKGRRVVPALVCCVWLAQLSPAHAIPPWLGERPAPEPAEVEPKAEAAPVPAPPVPPSAVVPPTAVIEFVPAPLGSVSTKQTGPRRPLHKNWVFWTFSAGLLVATVLVTIAVTDSAPDPYPGTLGTVVF